MAALPAVLTDQQSVTVIMDSIANQMEGLAFIFCNTLVPRLIALIPNLTAPTLDQVQLQTAIFNTILCGYTVKEEAVADLIKAAAKKTAVDLGIDPNRLCDCFCCCCHDED